MCSEVCTAIISAEIHGCMVVTDENLLQIDEAHFALQWKYKRSWLLQGDQASNLTISEAWVFSLKKKFRMPIKNN